MSADVARPSLGDYSQDEINEASLVGTLCEHLVPHEGVMWRRPESAGKVMITHISREEVMSCYFLSRNLNRSDVFLQTCFSVALHFN